MYMTKMKKKFEKVFGINPDMLELEKKFKPVKPGFYSISRKNDLVVGSHAKLITITGEGELEVVTTSTIRAINKIHNNVYSNVYEVETRNSIYYVIR